MKSKNSNFSFLPFSQEELNQIHSQRPNETKLAERISIAPNLDPCKYVILGICEDIGPQANHGFPGSTNAFTAFISRFVNTQSNRFLSGEEIGILGVVKQDCQFENISKSRNLVAELDDFVCSILDPIFKKGQIPIVIGGGHNNAFPISQAHFEASNQSLHVINLDPHADCRSLEGRHSGNPFSYGIKEGYINNYTVLGLHENYNSETIYNFLDTHDCRYTFFEKYLLDPEKLLEDLNASLNQQSQTSIGLEIDLDAISNMPSSAFTPSGFELNLVRKYIKIAGENTKVKYLHLPEGAPINDHENRIIGKTLSYLVIDFIKSNKSYL
jgi:formiminoglutamase